MKTLVTGAAGFVGSHLVERLVGRGDEVSVMIYDKDPIQHMDAGLSVTRHVGDIRDAAFVERAMEGIDRVFHLAAALNTPTTPVESFFTINVLGTRNVMEAAMKKGVRKVVHTSSCVTMKENRTRINESNIHRTPFSAPYMFSKYQGEMLAYEYGARGLPVTVLNPTIVYGPRDTHTLGEFFKLHLKPRIRLISFLDSPCNLVYVKDAVAAQILAMEKGRPGHKYLIGGEEVTLAEFLAKLDEVTGTHRPIIRIPEWMIELGVEIIPKLYAVFGRKFTVMRAQVEAMQRGTAVDFSKARTELGIPVTPLDEGICETVKWYKQEGLL